MDFSKERKNIHDLANHLTIIQGAVKKAIKTLESKKLLPEESERLIKADEYLKQSNIALRELREEIIKKISEAESR
ncbi:MAG: hypothetical protein K2P81_03515 [Bacteriovoracaceae bacterium]|nr:hypothetical protein [Bacteriovoracaceae bacterium]